MKQIEPGCLVMYIGNTKEYSGLTGVAQYFIPKSESTLNINGLDYVITSDCWFIRTTRPFKHRLADGSFCPVTDTEGAFNAKTLMRIDGDVDEESECDEISKVKETV